MPTSHLETNDTLRMKFKSTVADDFVTQLEGNGEFVRDTAAVTIVQGNYKCRKSILTATDLVTTVIFSCGETGKHILQCQ